MIFCESAEFKGKAQSLFHKWKAIIEFELPSSRVEHVGSTAVDGALTKGDVDLFVEVPSACHESSVSALERLGFVVKEDTHRDAELCMLESLEIEGLALQVVARGSVYEFFLKFRDALNSDRVLLERYNQLKISCAHDLEEEYRRKKTVFIEAVLQSL